MFYYCNLTHKRQFSMLQSLETLSEIKYFWFQVKLKNVFLFFFVVNVIPNALASVKLH